MEIEAVYGNCKLLGCGRSVDEDWSVVGWYAVVASKYGHYRWMYCLSHSESSSLGCVTSMKYDSSVNGRQTLYKFVMEFILLMERIKCWCNYPL